MSILYIIGPTDPNETQHFLTELFTDPEIIPMGPLQSYLGPYIAKRRTPKITAQYQQIGGSPIKKWTELQGAEMCRKLDELSPDTAPHKYYICFRYAAPQTESCINDMLRDGVTRAIAFSQYPQFSCTTTGSSYNHLWRELKRLQHESTFQWSVIDRWLHNDKFINSVKIRIEQGLHRLKSNNKSLHDDDILILFSAHSLPVKVVTRGDAYCHEVHRTVELVMSSFSYQYKHLLSWQSKVGYLPWLTPSTADTIQGLGKQGYKNILIVPIAFTSDHVETLYEIDIEYNELAHKSGITNFVRTDGLNDLPEITDALADIVHKHIASNQVSTPQYQMNCIHCINPDCRRILNPIKPYNNMRTKYHKQNIAIQSDDTVDRKLDDANDALNQAAAATHDSVKQSTQKAARM